MADLTRASIVEHGDATALETGERGLLFMVADGMGGAAAGEIASQMATELVFERLVSRKEPWLGEPVMFVAAMHDAAEYANEEIHRYASENQGHQGMGTTATIAGLLGDTLYLAQVGDSRAYLLRGGEARQLTKDQSLIQKLVEVGELTPEEAERSERRNIILQALGPEPDVVVDLTRQPVRKGDYLVLCSDGLSGLVKHDEIASIVYAAESPREAGERLVARANEYGGIDNITAVIVRFDGPGLRDADPKDDVGYIAFEEADAVRTGEIRVDSIPGLARKDKARTSNPAVSWLGGDPPAQRAKSSDSGSGPGAPPDAERRRKGEMWMFGLTFLLVSLVVAVAIYYLLRG